MARNPPWTYDELILAMDLYQREGLIDDRHPLVVELSEILNALPIHTVRPDAEKFRNANGVAMKLGNFARLDPAYPGKGLDAGAHRDEEVWDYFAERPDELIALAARIRQGAVSAEQAFPPAPEEGEDEVIEGRLLYRRHRTRERNQSLVKRKKDSVLMREGRLPCEVCGFDFADTYGELGENFIECHHTIPLSESGEETTTTLNDLAVVCSNCHRMLHRRQPWISVEDLQSVVTST